MVVEVGTCGESFPTDPALVRFLSTMDTAVGVER